MRNFVAEFPHMLKPQPHLQKVVTNYTVSVNNSATLNRDGSKKREYSNAHYIIYDDNTNLIKKHL